ncbi:MAG: LysR substrate-binding domain-containing protein [Gemmatimonas sp.]
MDTIKLMESYAAVVKLGSFSRAAREVRATRAMISKRIKALEDSLGVKLLHRNTHGLSVTAAGADYYESCVALLANLRSLTERMQDKRAAPRGELKILSTRTFSETILAPIVTDFCAQYPEVSVQITLVDRDRGSFATHLISGGFDMAILTGPIGDTSFVATPIGRLASVLVASPRYLARHGTPEAPADLARHNCLDPSGAAAPTWELRGPDGPVAVRVTGTLRTNGTLMVRHAALEGLGIALLREYLVADELRGGSLIRVLDDHAVDERTMYLIRHKDRYQPLRMKMFADHLIEQLARMTVPSSRAVTPARRARARARR